MILGRHSVNAAREIRHNAISHLQRILLGSSLTSETDQNIVEEVFNRVVFPLIDELLKTQVSSRDPQGMNETRLRGSALLCKVFMHLELRESRAKTDFRLLWIQVLDLLDRLMHVDRSSQLVCMILPCLQLRSLTRVLVRSSSRVVEECSLGNECCWNSGTSPVAPRRSSKNSMVEYTRTNGALSTWVPD